ncbi:MAG: hypothetical protein M3Y03_02860, partial [Verrucomicrobiota bacterium]|nr:hypothetical protein [Verrucomicrobiota bacterium]
MDFRIIPAAELSLAEQARVVNAAFANYIAGWSEMDADALARFLLLQGADLFYSRVVRFAMEYLDTRARSGSAARAMVKFQKSLGWRATRVVHRLL